MWLLLIAGETANGVLRTILIVPMVGDLTGRQWGVLSSSLIILAIAIPTNRWLAARTARSQLTVGGLWVALTVGFVIALGTTLGYSWERIASDYNVAQGGLLPLGLIVMAFAPLIPARLRNLK